MNFRELLLSLRLVRKNKREALLEKIKKQGFPRKEVFVSIDEFFNGNNDTGSIGCNTYPDPPTLSQFYEILSSIKNNTKTKDVLVRIMDIEDTEWFVSDAVYVFGDYKLQDVKTMFKTLKPDEIYEGMMYKEPSNIPESTTKYKAFSVWWD